MADFSWHAFYQGDLQRFHSLVVVPLAFLAWRLAAPPDARRGEVPEAASFVAGLTLLFAFETMIDPWMTGPFIEQVGLKDSFAATLISFAFVLLGDLRVLLLAIGVARPDRSPGRNLSWALAVSLIVPIFAGTTHALAHAVWPDIHPQTLWMLYEAGFLTLCVVLSRHWLPKILERDTANPDGTARIAFLRAVFGYATAYYALWWFADFLIVIGDLDLGWAIRIVPNQLYYAFWVPFVYFRFFSVRPGNAAR